MAHSLLRLKRTAVAAGAIIFIGITISSFGIVRAARYMPVNGITYTCSTGTACVEGNSTGKPWGVYGNSSGGNGVEGQSSASAHAGVAGVNLGTQGYGVYGESADLSGKYAALFGQGDANATNLLRVYNRATGASCIVDPYASLTCTGNVYGRGGGSENAVAGTNFDGGTGVFGNAYAGETGVLGKGGIFGVNGMSPETALSAESTGGSGSYGVYAQADSTTGVPLVAAGSAGKCLVDYAGNLKCTGTIIGGVNSQTRQRTSSGGHVIAYASESTSATIEDVGTARLVDGAASVPIDAGFASTIDRSRPYYVFLTPLGDTRGLYVSSKSPSGFDVREVQRGHSSVGFDYRIVARPFGFGTNRLPPAPALRRPRLPKPPTAQRIP